MIRTIGQRIYLVGLLPLAALAVALVLWNGYARIRDANRSVESAQEVTRQLLQAPALDALVIGNSITFETIAKQSIAVSTVLKCISLSDAHGEVLVSAGQCELPPEPGDSMALKGSSNDLSDLAVNAPSEDVLGALRISMNPNVISERIVAVAWQLVASLILIAAVIAVVGRLLATRLIRPIRAIDTAMEAVSRRDYTVAIDIHGEDEPARLAQAINSTIATIAGYISELELRRQDAHRALQDADEANLTRDDLVKSLTEELEEPMARMHTQLTQIAVANSNRQLREQIKLVMELLQDAHNNFADLMEIAATARQSRALPITSLRQVAEDLKRELGLLKANENCEVDFLWLDVSNLAGAFVPVDSARMRKATVYLVRAMNRRSRSSSITVRGELIRLSDKELQLSIDLNTLLQPIQPTEPSHWEEAFASRNAPPRAFGWTQREKRIVEYLLHEVGLVANYSVTAAGTAHIHLATKLNYDSTASHWNGRIDAAPPTTLLVSNDAGMMRLVERGGLGNLEVTMWSFARLQTESTIQPFDVVLIDIADDLPAAFASLEQLRRSVSPASSFIAVCPPGPIGDALQERLFERGFAAVVQKPLQYSRVLQVIRQSVSARNMTLSPRRGQDDLNP